MEIPYAMRFGCVHAAERRGSLRDEQPIGQNTGCMPQPGNPRSKHGRRAEEEPLDVETLGDIKAGGIHRTSSGHRPWLCALYCKRGVPAILAGLVPYRTVLPVHSPPPRGQDESGRRVLCKPLGCD
eukprot:scaffold328290_cov76-Tisochrysis_lutea.AAC.2